MSAVDLMLLGTILLWALNVTVTRYLVTHGFGPLAYATVRYFAATSLVLGLHAGSASARSGSAAATRSSSGSRRC